MLLLSILTITRDGKELVMAVLMQDTGLMPAVFLNNNLGLLYLAIFPTVIQMVWQCKLPICYCQKKKKNQILPALTDSSFLKKFAGRYVSDRGAIFNLYWNNRKLVSRHAGQTTGGTEWKLAVNENNKYQLNQWNNHTV